VELLVCIKCRHAPSPVTDDGVPIFDNAPASDITPGARLIAALSDRGLPEGVTLRAVECLQNCDRGCTVALRGGPSRWTYVWGHFRPDRDAEMLLDGAAKYRAADTGLIPWRERAIHLRKNCIARIPPLEASE
jgi:predicted metal-binding protein